MQVSPSLAARSLAPAVMPFRADSDDASAVTLLQELLEQAIALRSSDLHFEPYEERYRVRFRIDGVLQEKMALPLALRERLVARIKVLARLDISERRLPQDGRIKFRLGPERMVDLRVSTLPTLFGEKVVIRVLDATHVGLDMEALGYPAEDQMLLEEAIARPHGMVLVTGPTGSGKTLSLYSCLQRLNQPGVNIASVEDPCEIPLPGINQVNVHEKAGLTYASALRAFLRQDPDILMVGEIRDLETADMALKAAQTGHLVLSTLHTNDAPSAITRLRHMGVAAYHLAASLSLISAQRLVRRLCEQCRQPVTLTPEQILAAGFPPEAVDGPQVAYRPVGCPACSNGYRGRTGIFQVMPVSDAMRSLMLADASLMVLEQQAASEGLRSLRQAGLDKVLQGITSLEEVLAATHA